MWFRLHSLRAWACGRACPAETPHPSLPGIAPEYPPHVPGPMKNPNDLNAIREWKVKDEIAADGETSQRGRQLVPSRPESGEFGQQAELLLEGVQQPFGRCGVVGVDVSRDLDQIESASGVFRMRAMIASAR